MSGTATAATRSALRQSLELLLSDILRGAPDKGYALGPITYSDAVEVTLHKGDARFIVWLRPASDQGGAYRQTTHFKIGYQDDPPDPNALALIDATRAHLQRWEKSVSAEAIGSLFDGRAIASPNLEVLAVRTGLKPTCRLLVHPNTVDASVQQMRDEGLGTAVTPADAFVSRFRWGFTAGETTLVYVGRTEAAARHTADLERAMMTGWRRWWRSIAIERALGEALGYPSCCTEAYLKVRKLPNDTIRFQALARTSESASAYVNDVDETQSIISHFVCRYDCTPSQRYAEALFAELGRISSAAREARFGHLQGLVIRLRDGGALRCAGVKISGSSYHLTNVAAFGTGPRLDVWHSALRGADGLTIDGNEIHVSQRDREPKRLSETGAVEMRWFA